MKPLYSVVELPIPRHQYRANKDANSSNVCTACTAYY